MVSNSHKKLVLGTREGFRTPDLWYRKPTLYPIELTGRGADYINFYLGCRGDYQFWSASLPLVATWVAAAYLIDLEIV